MNPEYTIKNYRQPKKNVFSSYVLGGDISGTNTNLCVVGIQKNVLHMLFSLHFKTHHLPSLIPAVETTLEYAQKKHGVTITTACIGAAGVISPSADSTKLTNAPWDIHTKEIIKKTSLQNVFLINDFQAVGYGINLLNPSNKKDIYPIKQGKKTKHLHQIKAVIGAGTGLGKSILVYNNRFHAYHPLASEGGHNDLPIKDNFELQLITYIKKIRNIKGSVRYEDVLSGTGIENIYRFFQETKKFKPTEFTKKIQKSSDKPVLISQYRKKDKTCSETFRLFTRFYGRCAKNFALDTMALGGMYIAGGIASKNKDIFKTKDFLDEFEDAYKRSDVLKQIPIYVVVNYDVSLYGACYAAIYYLKKERED